MQYQYAKDEQDIRREDCIKGTNAEGIIMTIPNDPANRHWQEYQAWLAADPENNIPQEEGE